jgi:hypothetical protein
MPNVKCIVNEASLKTGNDAEKIVKLEGELSVLESNIKITEGLIKAHGDHLTLAESTLISFEGAFVNATLAKEMLDADAKKKDTKKADERLKIITEKMQKQLDRIASL